MNIKKLTAIAILAAAAICLSVFEQMLPPVTGIPGGKLGLANMVTMVAIHLFGGVTAIGIAVTRSILGSLLYGGLSALPYSLAGAAVSSVLMAALSAESFRRRGERNFPAKVQRFRGGLSFIGIGVIGGVSHNMAQVVVAAGILQNIYLLTYMPVLIIIAVFTGGFTGLCALLITQRLKFVG